MADRHYLTVAGSLHSATSHETLHTSVFVYCCDCLLHLVFVHTQVMMIHWTG